MQGKERAERQRRSKKSRNPKDFNQNCHDQKSLIHAEISVYPIGTDSTSMSFYVARAIDAIKDIQSVKCVLTPMGTVLESDDVNGIFDASKIVIETVHRLGVKRVEVILKVDSRNDKTQTIQDKLDAVNKHL